MPREIIFCVTKNGKIESNYTGYEGKECLDEAEKYAKAIAAIGVDMEVESVVMKSDGDSSSTPKIKA